MTEQEWERALKLTIDQRDQAVRALADLIHGGWDELEIAQQVVAEPWAQEVFDGD